MIQEFKVKPLFKDQVHERQQFTLKFEGVTYQGIFHDENIQWFHPQPENSLEEEELQDLETKVYDLVTKHAYQDFKVKPLFEDQVHERHQFTLNFEGDHYHGIFHDEEIQWFHPQPENNLEEEELQDLESKVYDLMTNHIYQEFKEKQFFEHSFHERQQ